MKHAGPSTLANLQPLLQRLREETPLAERTPGAFYFKSKAFLHFHEDTSGPYADVKLDAATFSRVRVATAQEQAHFMRLVAGCLAPRS